jgi:ferredoxin
MAGPIARVAIDKQSCLSSGRCITAAPEAFRFDDDYLAEPTEGAQRLPEDRLRAVARACPGLAIALLDARGDAIDP